MKRLLMGLALALITGSALAQKAEVLWLGQAAFRITTPGGKVIMIDPWMRTNPKTPANFKDLHAVGKIDLILVTHAHFDHFADAPDLAKMHDAPMYGPAGLGTTVGTLEILPAKLAPRFGKGGTITPFGPNSVKITAFCSFFVCKEVNQQFFNYRMISFMNFEMISEETFACGFEI
jgi:L-ascorbate metabolism protein UlaG (beta-lactamase superfamily)